MKFKNILIIGIAFMAIVICSQTISATDIITHDDDGWNVNLKSWNYTECPEVTIECDGVPNVCPAPHDYVHGILTIPIK